MKLLDEIKKHRNEIQTDAYSISWGELLNNYRDKELKINPDYQRLFRWTIKQQTQFIESILLDIPVPALFLAQNDDSKLEVIDGLQRISTIIKFFSKSVFADAKAPSSDESTANDLKIPTILEEGPLVPSLANFACETLPESLVLGIKKSRVHIIFLKKESTKRNRYEVFRRLNTYGSQLTAQEVRNCAARLLGTKFPDALIELGLDSAIQNALVLGDEREQRRDVEALLLRLLAFNFSKDPLAHDIEAYLDDFMEYASEDKFQLKPTVVKKVLDTFKLIGNAYPDGGAFKFRKKGKISGSFSTNIFDVVASGVFHNIKTLSEISFKEKLENLLNSKDLKEVTGAGSNTRKKMQGRVELGKTWFK